MKKKLLLVAVTVITVLLLASCNPDANKLDETPSSYVTFGKSTKRDFTTSYETPEIANLYWYYTAVKADGYGTSGQTGESLMKSVSSTNSMGLDGEVGPFSQGKWTFVLRGYSAALVESSTNEGFYEIPSSLSTKYPIIYKTSPVTVTLYNGKTVPVSVSASLQGSRGYIDLSGAYFNWKDGGGTDNIAVVVTLAGENSTYTTILDVSYNSETQRYDLPESLYITISNLTTNKVYTGIYNMTISAYIPLATADVSTPDYTLETPFASQSINIRVLGNATTKISGDLIEGVDSKVEFDIAASELVVLTGSSATVNTAPVAEKTTSVDFSSVSLAADSHMLNVEVLTGESAEGRFNIASESTDGSKAIAALNLTLTAITNNVGSVSQETVSDFSGNAVTVTTYIEPGFPEGTINVVYVNEDGTIPEAGQPTEVKYDPTDGKLTFKTTHFSTFVVTGLIFESGNGTEENPYVISTSDQLRDFASAVNAGMTTKGKYFALGNNIDLENKEWTPIGILSNFYASFDEDAVAFAGNFDGRNYTISNLKISKAKNSGVDLADSGLAIFGVVAANGNYIKNLTVENVKIKGNSFVGPVVGLISSYSGEENTLINFDNIHVKGNIDLDASTNVAGLIGRIETVASMVLSNSDVIGSDGSIIKGGFDRVTSFVGGLIGAAYSNTKNEFSKVKVSNVTIEAIHEAAGGIAGLINVGSVSNATIENTTISTTLATINKIKDYWDRRAVGAIAGHIVSQNDNVVALDTITLTNVVVGMPLNEVEVFCNGLFGTYRNDDYAEVNLNASVSGWDYVNMEGLSLQFVDSSTWDKFTAHTAWYDNNTEATSFEISTGADLLGLSNLVNSGISFEGKTITLTSDINMQGGAGWKPIGNATLGEGNVLSGNVFAGTFDGNGHTILKMTVTSNSAKYNDVNENQGAGVFGAVSGENAVVKNLIVEECQINNTASKSAGIAIGILANGATAEKINSLKSGSYGYIYGGNAGGVVGRVIDNSKVIDCSSNVTVRTTPKLEGPAIGGIVGVICNSSAGGKAVIKGCTNAGKVYGATSGTNRIGGGIVGVISGSVEISDCQNSGAVNSYLEYAGPIVGKVEGDVTYTITGCSNTGTITGKTETNTIGIDTVVE